MGTINLDKVKNNPRRFDKFKEAVLNEIGSNPQDKGAGDIIFDHAIRQAHYFLVDEFKYEWDKEAGRFKGLEGEELDKYRMLVSILINRGTQYWLDGIKERRAA